MTALSSYLEEKRLAVEAALRSALPPAEGPAARLHEAMTYSLMAGGKRIRPILAIAAAESCGADAARVMPAACALEFIHTYSLVHDDLPCMDNDDLRRGRPTNHKVYGETMALLAGDGLLTHAFRLIADNGHVPGVPAGAVAEVLAVVADAAGPTGMVGGQAADWLAEGRETGEAEVVYIHTHKTGAMIRASVLVGAILAGAPESRRAALASYGEKLGLLFQIVDDCLNVEGDAARLGKATGSDAAHKKATFPAVAGLPAAKARADALVAEARGALGTLNGHGGMLADLAEFVRRRES